MAMTNVELYEALKGTIPDNAARMIAEAYHPARELATRTDLAKLELATRTDLAKLEGKIDSIARLQQWMIAFFIPVWAGTFGTLVAVVLKG